MVHESSRNPLTIGIRTLEGLTQPKKCSSLVGLTALLHTAVEPILLLESHDFHQEAKKYELPKSSEQH